MNGPPEDLAALVAAFVGQAVGYFAVVGLVWVLVWKVFAARLAPRKVPTPRSSNRAQVLHEVAYSLSTLAVGTLGVVIVGWLSAHGHAHLSSNLADFSPGQIALTFVGLLLLNDLWFYGFHRLLHTPWAFKHVHSVHHRSVEVTPFSSYSFHPVEGFLLGAWIYPVAVLVPIWLPMLAALQGLGLANNVMSHLGYELFPKGLLRVPGLRWVNSATFHSMHHTRVNGNYGLMLRVWDHALGTAVPGYDEVFRTRSEQAPERTTGR
jgi:sterol desaturase/sphingolipid hydroxylase (fatty acid hydroxylase superfamily)